MNCHPFFARLALPPFLSIGKLLMISALVLSIFLLGGNAQAHSNLCTAANCTSNLAFDGNERYSSGWGAKANIGDYQVPSVCAVSAAWTMIDNQSSGAEFAQVGYARLSNWSTSTTYYFYEYADGSNINPPVMLSADTKGWGSSDEFTTYYNTGNQYIEPEINGQVQVYIFVGWHANDQQWFAEVHAYEDYVVGGYNHHTIFGSVQYLYNGVWYTTNTSNDEVNNTPYGAFSASGSSFYVWDTRIS